MGTTAKTQFQKPLLAVLKGETQTPPPIWLMRQAGRYLPEFRAVRKEIGGFLDLCYNPKKACEVTLQPIERYGFDAAILFSDILVVPHGLGQHVEFRTGEGPVLEALKDAEDLAKLDLSQLHEKMAPVYAAVSEIRTALAQTAPKTALIGFAGAPWTLACYMVEGKGSKDYARTKEWAYGQTDLFQKLVDLLVEAIAAYLVRQIDAGAEAVQIFDSWAGVLPEDALKRWSLEPITAIAEKVKTERPETPIIAFPRGAGQLYESFAKIPHIDALGLDTTVPLDWAVEVLQPHVALQGNLDPIRMVVGGAEMDQAIDYILEKTAKGRFIFNLGHGCVPNTPPENVARLVDRIRNFSF